MSIWNKILLFLIFVTGAFYSVLVSNMHQLAKQNNEKLLTQQKTLGDLTTTVFKLHGEIFSDTAEVAVEWNKMPLDSKMNQLIALRGGELWLHCVNPGLPQQDGDTLRTSFCLPESFKPQQINDVYLKKNAPIFIFDSGVKTSGEEKQASDIQETAATFLGVFLIDNFNEEANEVLVQSIGILTEEEQSRINQSVQGGNEWFVYINRLPIDSPSLLTEWLSDPNDTVAPLLSEKIKTYLLQQQETETAETVDDNSTIDDIALETPADTEKPEAINESDPFSIQADENQAALDMLSSKERLPVDYNERLYRRLDRRMLLELSIDYCQRSVDDLRNVICDQLAAIGFSEIPEEILSQIGPVPDEAKKMTQTFAETKAALKEQTIMAKKEELANLLNAALAEVNLVKDQLDKTSNVVSGLKQRISELVNLNSELAVKIAKAQFEAADKIIQESENITADSSVGISFSRPLDEI